MTDGTDIFHDNFYRTAVTVRYLETVGQFLFCIIQIPVCTGKYRGIRLTGEHEIGADRFRTLPYIGALKREVYEK